MNEILKQYESFLKTSATCKSEESIRDYLLSIDMFCRISGKDVFNAIQNYRSFHSVFEQLIELTWWPNGRSKKRWGNLHTYKVATCCVVFFRWALAMGFTPHKIYLDDPKVGHLFQKGVGKPPESFDWTDPELQKLLRDPNNSVKRVAIYHLLRSSGIRPVEFGRLLRVNYQKELLDISRRKGGMPGFVPIDPEAQNYIDHYLKCLELHYKGPWFFPKDDYSGPINRHGLWKMLSNHGKKLGIHFYPYKLRHSLAAELASKGHDAMTISDVYGHKDPRTTQIYFHLSKKKIKEIYRPQPVTA